MMVIQPALLDAVHVHPAATVTVTLPVAAADVVRFEDVGEITGAHGSVNAKVLDRGVDAVPPGPTALTMDSYTIPGVSAVVRRVTKSTRIMPSVWGAGLPRSAVDTGDAPPATYTSRVYFVTRATPLVGSTAL